MLYRAVISKVNSLVNAVQCEFQEVHLIARNLHKEK